VVKTRTGTEISAPPAAVLLVCACLLPLMLLGLLASSAQSASGASTAGCPGANLKPNARNARAVESATLCLIDQVRAAHRLHPLRANLQLGLVAGSQVASMVRLDYFSDNRPTGQTPMSLVADTRYKAHATDISVGQNIAWGTTRYSTPAHIVAEWLASGPHREVMLSSEFHDAGVAVRSALPRVLGAGRRGAIYVVDFGLRRKA
jgi:uncharacterized protein YkwD